MKKFFSIALLSLFSTTIYAQESCVAIQAQINFAIAQRKNPQTKVSVIIPAGEYLCTSPIVISESNIEVKGMPADKVDTGTRNIGKQNTVNIKLANNADCPVIVIGAINTKDGNTVDKNGQVKIVENVSLSGINIDGNRKNQWFECWTPPQVKEAYRMALGTPAQPFTGARNDDRSKSNFNPITNNTCDEGYYTEEMKKVRERLGMSPDQKLPDITAIRNNAITIRGAKNISVSEVHLSNAISGGLVTEKFCENLNLKRIEATKNYFDGFAGYLTQKSVLDSCYFHHNDGAAISLDIGFHFNEIKNSSLEGNEHQGIFMRASSDNVIRNTQILNNGYQGVFIAASESSVPETPVLRFDNRMFKLKLLQSRYAAEIPLDKVALKEAWFQSTLKRVAERRNKALNQLKISDLTATDIVLEKCDFKGESYECLTNDFAQICLTDEFEQKILLSLKDSPDHVIRHFKENWEKIRKSDDQLEAFKKFYLEVSKRKRDSCSNNTQFINSVIMGSGQDKKLNLGTGIRVNDDECIGNTVDEATFNYFSNTRKYEKNLNGDFTTGTQGTNVFSEVKLQQDIFAPVPQPDKFH